MDVDDAGAARRARKLRQQDRLEKEQADKGRAEEERAMRLAQKRAEKAEEKARLEKHRESRVAARKARAAVAAEAIVSVPGGSATAGNATLSVPTDADAALDAVLSQHARNTTGEEASCQNDPSSLQDARRRRWQQSLQVDGSMLEGPFPPDQGTSSVDYMPVHGPAVSIPPLPHDGRPRSRSRSRSRTPREDMETPRDVAPQYENVNLAAILWSQPQASPFPDADSEKNSVPALPGDVTVAQMMASRQHVLGNLAVAGGDLSTGGQEICKAFKLGKCFRDRCKFRHIRN
eukprot:TRINITY_DN53085_c0_g1_i1.p1 TRINITY_DN53085_c0_g1~~TRINITY_DN53085_c0_g1_i1.p1  ORF type:complete len:290 (-),score=36.75 TRINITY_DN53085_c0_g1_i1:11-880(-)